MNKKQKLTTIAEHLTSCRECKQAGTGMMVFGEGNVNADVMFVGEAPGKTEAKTGRPFVGRSGKLLRSLIREMGFEEKDVYITSPVKYLPKRGTPSKGELNHSLPYFKKQIAIIDPKVMVLLGKTAIAAVLGEDISILKRHGETYHRDGRLIFITIHPAAAIRFQKYRNLIVEDFQKLKMILSPR